MSYADVCDISSKRGIDYTGRHINDTRTIHWEIYYVHHPQSDRTLFVDKLALLL